MCNGSSKLRLIARGSLHQLDKCFDLRPRLLQAAPALEISLPLRRLRERFGRLLIQRLGHQGNQITYHARMVEQRFDNRLREFILIRGAALWIDL